MVPMVWIGALLVICGVLWTARVAIYRDELSEPHPTAPGGVTLEPQRRGLRFLGLGKNWPGIALVALGAILLLLAGIG